MSTNLVFLEGNITREPRYDVTTGYPRWSATLANSEVRWNSETKQETVYTNWIFITAAGATAERLINDGVDKGSKISLRGSIVTYVKEDGNGKETKTQVRIEGYDILRHASSSHSTPQGDNAQGTWGSQDQNPAGGWGSQNQNQQPQTQHTAPPPNHQQQQQQQQGGWPAGGQYDQSGWPQGGQQ